VEEFFLLKRYYNQCYTGTCRYGLYTFQLVRKIEKYFFLFTVKDLNCSLFCLLFGPSIYDGCILFYFNCFFVFLCIVFIGWQEDVNILKPVDPDAKEVSFNPKYEQLFTPQVRFYIFIVIAWNRDFLQFEMRIRDFFVDACSLRSCLQIGNVICVLINSVNLKNC